MTCRTSIKSRLAIARIRPSHLLEFHASLLTVTKKIHIYGTGEVKYDELTIPNYTRNSVRIPGLYLL